MKKLLTDVMVELHVPDFEQAKKFYGDLGFAVVWQRKTDVLSAKFMVLRRGDSILNFFGGDETVYRQNYFKQFPRTTKRGYQVEISIPVDGVDELYKTIEKKYKNQIVQPLKERVFKTTRRKDFRMVDPFGFYLCLIERYNWVDNRDKEGNPL